MKRPGATSSRSPTRQRGAALLLVLMLVTTVGLGVLFANRGAAAHRYARDPTTDHALMQARTALIGYAATYRDTHPNSDDIRDKVFGYLLCPDLDNDGTAEPSCGAANQTMVGRLPYKTLGLPDFRDAASECLWYIVSGSHKNNPKTGSMNWDTRGHLRIEDAAGTILSLPDDASGGAVAVVIAPGAPLAGQTRPVGTRRCSGDGSNSIGAYLDGPWNAATATRTAYAAATPTSPSTPLVVVAGQSGSATNNDRVAWITSGEIFAMIKKRSDFNGPLPGGQLNRLIADQAAALAALPDPDGATTVGSGPAQRLVGNPPEGTNHDDDLKEYRSNWRNQFRYVKCRGGSACLNGGNCAAALIFAGERIGGGPRSATETISIDSFLEGDRLAIWNGTSDTFTINDAYSAQVPADDVALCLNASGGGSGRT